MSSICANGDFIRRYARQRGVTGDPRVEQEIKRVCRATREFKTLHAQKRCPTVPNAYELPPCRPSTVRTAAALPFLTHKDMSSSPSSNDRPLRRRRPGRAAAAERKGRRRRIRASRAAATQRLKANPKRPASACARRQRPPRRRRGRLSMTGACQGSEARKAGVRKASSVVAPPSRKR